MVIKDLCTSGNLDGFITVPKSQPEPIAISQEVRDRGSTFVAHVYHATTVDEAKARMNHLKYYVHREKPASHEIAAWRCMMLKPGRTGLGGPEDFDVKEGSVDDGESWAGGKVLKVMKYQAIVDAVLIVSRWYGGIMLGPARFAHIETCALEICREFKRSEELRENIALLINLDDILADARAELARITDTPTLAASQTKGKRKTQARLANSYSSLDLPKIVRLVNARNGAIDSVKALIAKHFNKDKRHIDITENPASS